jgi:type I restriction enzyme R subunit
MTLFKQMIGRGTRIYIDKERKINKWHFEILDFRDATRLFFDPEFDGEPEIEIKKKDDGQSSKRSTGSRKKTEIEGKEVTEDELKKIHIQGSKRVAKLHEIYYVINDDGQALEISDFLDFTRKGILTRFPKFADFARVWTDASRKGQIIEDFKDHDILIEEVRRTNPNLANADVFDIICHVAYDKKPLTRRERANNVKKRNYFGKYEGKAREVLEALLEKYADYGILNLEDENILDYAPFSQIGKPQRIVKLFCGFAKFEQALKELESEIYKEVA